MQLLKIKLALEKGMLYLYQPSQVPVMAGGVKKSKVVCGSIT